MYDILVIGGGVVGAMLIKELAQYDCKTILLEKEDDVSMGASRANSGIIHAGYDCTPNTNKARFNVEGCSMMYPIAEELGVPHLKIGSLVVTDNNLSSLTELLEKGKANGVDCEIIERDRILEIEPNVNDDIKYALYAKEAGVISPYKLTIAATDYAILNGVEVKTNAAVIGITNKGDYYEVITAEQTYCAKVVINSAGAYASDINAMLGEFAPETEHRRGEYYLLDKKERANISTVLFPLPDENGKGILVSPTADGNVIYGPTSTLSDREEMVATREGLMQIDSQMAKSYKCPNLRNVIRLYSGMRSVVGHDFVIEEGSKNSGYIYLLGICSPALTASPAIAKFVVETMVAKYAKLSTKTVIPYKKPAKITAMNNDELNAKIAEDSSFGKIICRCETVSEGEIIAAIHSPLGAHTVDAVKRRVRAGMGRCQGGFCMPNIIRIIAKELNIPVTAVQKGGEGSEIAIAKLSEVNYEEIL